MGGSGMSDRDQGKLLVRGEGVARRYGHDGSAVVALREATFTIRAGDRIALVGPSGSGKSTLMHLIAGIDPPSAGALSWPGLTDGQPLRPTQVGVAFQGLSLLPQLDVAENIALPLLLGGTSDADAARAAGGMVEAFHLDEVADKLPEQISGGQAQRTAVARAVVGSPRLILADEPTGQQDQAGARSLLSALWQRADRLNAALLVATHDEGVADRFPIRWTLTDQRLVCEEEPRSR
jgi:ABC-type lipoprotein export system ATPase subunit